MMDNSGTKYFSDYFNGYKAGLTNFRSTSEFFNLNMPTKEALSWLNGWLDGIECVKMQTSEQMDLPNVYPV